MDVRREENKMKREKTTFEMVLDVMLAVLIPMTIAGIWFLTQVRWWA